MTVEELKSLKSKIQEAERKKSRAEGVIDRITATWQKEYGFSTVEAAKAFCDDLKTNIKRNEERLADLETKIEAAVDWDSL